jgi:hypothetical protein
MFLVPFLPQDNVLLDKSTDEALQILNEDLAILLRCDNKTFWQTLREENSLQACLNSYLQFARSSFRSLLQADCKYHTYICIIWTCWIFGTHASVWFKVSHPDRGDRKSWFHRRGHDLWASAANLPSQLQLELAKRVFLIFLRM